MTRLELRRPLARDLAPSARRRTEDAWSRLSYALIGAGALCLAAATIATAFG